jgi:hypothetical protein
MVSQIPGGADGVDQLVCDGKTLRGSAVEAEDGILSPVCRPGDGRPSKSY